MNRQKKIETTFRRSSALFDLAGVLVSWDAGFEAEFGAIEGLALEGGTYFGIFGAILSRNFQFRTVDGEEIEAESALRDLNAFGIPRSFQYRNPAGQIVNVEELLSFSGGVFRVAEDVTEEWTRKEELAETKRRLNAAHRAPTVVPFTFRVSPEGRMELPPPSDGVKRIFGVSSGFDASDPMAIYSRIEMTAQQRAAMNDEARRCIATLEPFVAIYRVRDEDGNLRWIHNSLLPRRLPDGTTVFEGGLRDVTSETLAQDQVDLLRAVVVQSSDSIIVIETGDAETSRILYINPAFERLFGRSLTEVAGRDAREYTQNPKELALNGLLRERLARGDIDPVEFLVPRPDGTSAWVEARVCLLQGQLDGVHRWAVISRDISERRRSEDELAHSERMLRDAQRLAKTGTWEADLHTGELRWSRGMYDLMGLDPERHAPDRQHFLSLVHPDDRETTMALSEHVFTGQGGILSRNYRLLLNQIIDNAAYGAKWDSINANGTLLGLDYPTAGASNPVGQWDHFRVAVDDAWITIELNGKQVVKADLTRWTVAHRNPNNRTNKYEQAIAALPREGFIGLQNYGGALVWFRNIRVKPLTDRQPKYTGTEKLEDVLNVLPKKESN